MPTTHINAEKHDIADIVLLPGDPYRAKWAAENFLKNSRLVNDTRGMLGLTGEYQGREITIHGTGMGRPSIAIYAHELITAFDAKCLIRIGSAGALQDDIALRDLVIAQSASTLMGINQSWLGNVQLAPTANFDLLRAAANAAEAQSKKVHIGNILTGDLFYEGSNDAYDRAKAHGVLAVEMETSELYTIAARHGAKALSILTISDHIYKEENLSSAARQESFGEMVELALQTAIKTQ